MLETLDRFARLRSARFVSVSGFWRGEVMLVCVSAGVSV